MKNKKGISLIVLVITIIVMIILAAAVVLTLNNTGIINKADEAVNKSDIKQVEHLATLVWSEEYMDGKRGDTLITDVLEKLKDYTDKYEIEVTDKGVTVGPKLPETWKYAREYDEQGLLTNAYIKKGKVSYELGSIVNYMPEGVGPEGEEYTGGWQLLGVDDQGRFLLCSGYVASVNIYDVNTEDKVAYLHELASPYKDGTIGVEARSIMVEDLNKVVGFNPDTYKGEDWLKFLIWIETDLFGTSTPYETLEAEYLESLGMTSKEQLAIYDYNMPVTYTWVEVDGELVVQYSYEKNGKTIVAGYTDEYCCSSRYDEETGTWVNYNEYFEYYDAETKTWGALIKEEGNSVTITNKMYHYIATDKLAWSNVAGMLYTGRYWLANEFSGFYGDYFGSGIMLQFDAYVHANPHFSLLNGNREVRAVVTLAKGITLKESTTNPGTYDIVQ